MAEPERVRAVALWKRIAGPLLTLAVGLVAACFAGGALHTPGLNVIFLVLVAYSVLVGGLASGVVSAVLALLLYAYPLLFTRGEAHDLESLQRIVLQAVVTPVAVLTLGHLRARERSLRENAEAERKRAAAILESIGDGFFAVDHRYQCIYVNHAAEQIVGKTRGELLGRSLWDLFPPLRGSTWERELRHAVEQQVAVHFEEPCLPPGTWFEAHVYPSADGLSIYLRCIDDRKRVEQATRDHARREAAVAALGDQALRGVEIEALLDAAVRAVADTLDVELVKVLELLPGEGELVLRAGVGWDAGSVGRRTVGARERSQAGYTLLCRAPVIVEDLASETRFQGPALLLEQHVVSGMSVVIGRSERPFGILGAHTRRRRVFTPDDVHFLQAMANVLGEAISRKRAEEALVVSERRFRQVAENIREVFFVTNADETETYYVSPAYERVWGRSCESLYAWPRSWLDAVIPEDRARAIPALPAMSASGMDSFSVEYRIARPDGTIRWIWARGFPIHDEHGKVVRVAGLAEDVTDRIAMEENARRLAAAEAAIRARDEIVSTVSHDLRSPLSSILLSVDMLEQSPPEERRRKQLRVIRRSGERMSRLIQDLFDVAKMESGSFSVVQAALELGPILHDTCEALQPQAAEKVIDLGCEIAPDLPPVSIDRDRIIQALTNVLENAIKFTPEGGRVVMGAAPSESGVRITVADTGPGIPREHLARVFERFWQAGKDRRGAGLGLAIVKGIVEAHGGSVGVESEPGHGSTFHITLPALPLPDHGRRSASEKGTATFAYPRSC